jgi:hypothetical protein
MSAIELFDISDWNDSIDYEFNNEQFIYFDSQELISFDFWPSLTPKMKYY